MRERVVGHQCPRGACPVEHAGSTQIGHGEARGRQMRLARVLLFLQVLLDHAQRHRQAALGGLGQLRFAPLLGHRQTVHQHGQRVRLGFRHGPEAPAQGFGVFARRGGGDAHPIGNTVVTSDVERTRHALPHHHIALGPRIDDGGHMAIGVDGQKRRCARAAALVIQLLVVEVEAEFGGGPQGAHGAGRRDAVDREAHAERGEERDINRSDGKGPSDRSRWCAAAAARVPRPCRCG